ncbi:hypothetical protein [Planctomycetes bacterium K23_9]|uniref:Uncharacterized protein n=1 Tax=Stieleria marina TaxID=1930275 RepID=A0A517NZH9_9BACT|nr:hypothetical protein K239x_45310 [Planctomycetes bacterium K23_9]
MRYSRITAPVHPMSVAKLLSTRAVLIAATMLLTLGQKHSGATEVTSDSDSILVTAASYQEYGDLYADLQPFFRIEYFNAEFFEPANEVLCSAIFVPNVDNLLVSHFFGMTEQGINDHIALLQGNAEMMQIEAYDAGDSTRYAYIAYHKPDPVAWYAAVGVAHEVDDAVMDSLSASLKRVNWCHGDPSDGASFLFKEDNTDTFVPTEALTLSQLNLIREYVAEFGFRMTSVEVKLGIDAFPSVYYPVFKQNGNLQFTTERMEQGYAFDMHDIDSSELSHWTPRVVAMDIQHNFADGYASAPDFVVAWRGSAQVRRKILEFDGADKFAIETKQASGGVDRSRKTTKFAVAK